MIPFFLRHYERFVDRIFIYDDGSTDRSEALLRAHPNVEWRLLETAHHDRPPRAGALLDFYNQVWKKSRGMADWVILCNLDELFYHPAMNDYLKKCRVEKVTVIPSQGWDMVSWGFPHGEIDLPRTRRRGVRKHRMDKVFAFDPEEISQSNFCNRSSPLFWRPQSFPIFT